MDDRLKMFQRRGTEAPKGQKYVTWAELKPLMDKFPDSFQRIRNYHKEKFGVYALAVDVLNTHSQDPYYSPARIQARLDKRVKRREAGLDPFADVSEPDRTNHKPIEI